VSVGARTVSASEHAIVPETALYSELAAAVDPRTLDILARRRRTAVVRRRGWLVRRVLLLADVLGLILAFAVAEVAFGAESDIWLQTLLFAVMLPAWIVLAKIYGLYDRDEQRTDHTTIDDVVGVFHFVTTGVWLSFLLRWVAAPGSPDIAKLFTFWVIALAFVTFGRSAGRTWCHTRITYLQNTLIVGAGEVGQTIARKIVQHPEYGINLVGFVDAQPLERRRQIEHVAVLGGTERLPDIVRLFDIERVIVAFSNESHETLFEWIRQLRDLDVQIDIVPRLFEMIGLNVGIHMVEGLPVLGLPPAKMARSSRLLKRAIDFTVAAIGLLITAPLFAYIAFRIKRDSPGPVFFRQTRLGMNMREFTLMKFRTMKVETDDAPHREYIASVMTSQIGPESDGLFKLTREDSVTKVGRWLRRTSLDELPQLINVLRGDMSLVGPRPCIPYETESFAPHHFERFLVPAGITGFWQVTARARASFREALEMDVAYARSCSLGLDLTLMLRTLRHVFGQRGTA
jgi:exopolysaccharide biosynthesis polyprenyl glycosylphosphotransferase